MMFSRANQQQATIESTRANKLLGISTAETNAKNTLAANVSALKSKYQGEQVRYAQSAYGSAVKQYQTNQKTAFDENLALQKLSLSEQKATSSAQRSAGSAQRSAGSGSKTATNAVLKAEAGFKIKQGSQGQYMFSDKSGEPLSMAQFIQGSGKGTQDVVNLLENGTGYDRNVLSNAVKAAGGAKKFQNLSDAQIIKYISKADKGQYYGF